MKPLEKGKKQQILLSSVRFSKEGMYRNYATKPGNTQGIPQPLFIHKMPVAEILLKIIKFSLDKPGSRYYLYNIGEQNGKQAEEKAD